MPIHSFEETTLRFCMNFGIPCKYAVLLKDYRSGSMIYSHYYVLRTPEEYSNMVQSNSHKKRKVFKDSDYVIVYPDFRLPQNLIKLLTTKYYWKQTRSLAVGTSIDWLNPYYAENFLERINWKVKSRAITTEHQARIASVLRNTQFEYPYPELAYKESKKLC
jgi:hypothetical protein